MNEKKILSNKIRELRSSTISVDDFHYWVAAQNKILTKVLSPGLLLKLKHGDKFRIMSASKQLLSACLNCSTLFREGEFIDRFEHVSCANVVERAVRSGQLFGMCRPNWYDPNSCQLGADAYFSCSTCGAQWTLVEPEREYRGLWERLA